MPADSRVRLFTVPDAAAELTRMGRPTSTARMYALVANGEFEAAWIGGRLMVTDLEWQVRNKAKAHTAARRERHAPKLQIVRTTPRRFGNGEPKEAKS